MENPRGRRGSHLFTIRVWAEQLSEDRAEWRGKIQHIPVGEAHYFRELILSTLEGFRVSRARERALGRRFPGLMLACIMEVFRYLHRSLVS